MIFHQLKAMYVQHLTKDYIMIVKFLTKTRFQLVVGGPNKTVTNPGVGVYKGVSLIIHRVAEGATVTTNKVGSWTRHTVSGTYTAGELDHWGIALPVYKEGDVVLEAELTGNLVRVYDAKTFCESASTGIESIDEAPYQYYGVFFGNLSEDPVNPQPSPWGNLSR